MTTATAKQTYRRRKAILAKLEDIGRTRIRLLRRIDPGYSSGYVPGPADAADRAIRDPQGAVASLELLEAEIMPMVREYVELTGVSEKTAQQIAEAIGTGKYLFVEESEWSDDGRGNYYATAWKANYSDIDK